MWRGAGTGCSRASSQLVADVAQQGPAIRLVALVLNAERRLAIDHAEDTTTLLGLGNQDLDRVRRRTVDAAHLRDLSTFTGKPSRRNTMNECPAAMASAFCTASSTSPESLPARRTSRAPEASQKASPKRRCGDEPTRASYRSSTVLMKCDCPKMRLAPSGTATGTTVIAAPPSRTSLRADVAVQPPAAPVEPQRRGGRLDGNISPQGGSRWRSRDHRRPRRRAGRSQSHLRTVALHQDRRGPVRGTGGLVAAPAFRARLLRGLRGTAGATCR